MNYVFQVIKMATVKGMLFFEVKKALMRFIKLIVLLFHFCVAHSITYQTLIV